MPAAVTLEGPQCNSFLTASGVGIMDPTLGFSSAKPWLLALSLSVDMFIRDLRQDEVLDFAQNYDICRLAVS